MNRKSITKFYIRHLSDSILLIGILLGGAIIISCTDKERVPESYVAKVDDEYLTEDEVDSYLNEHDINKLRADEYIRTWVRNKVLIKSAEANGTDEREVFLDITKKAYESIIINLFIESRLSEKLGVTSNEDLLNYFNSNKQRFILENNFFILNIMLFNSISEAEGFLTAAGNTIKEKLGKINISDDAFELSLNKKYYEYELPSNTLYDALKYVEAGEYSGIIETEPNKFEIVQVGYKINKGDVPDYKFVIDFVREAYIAEQRQILFDELIADLYDNFEIEINREYN